MTITVDWFTLLVVDPILVIGLWALIYWAVRWANLDTPSLPRFSAYVDKDGEQPRLHVANIGTGPALDLAVGWADVAAAQPFGQVPILLPHATFSCDLPPAPARSGTPSPVRRQGVEWLVVRFEPSPIAASRRTRVPVRIQEQPDARRTV